MGARHRSPRVKTPLEISYDASHTLPSPGCQPAGQRRNQIWTKCGTGRAVLAQIAGYSPVLNQSTGLTNEGFTCAFTHRITGSYRLLFGAGREMDDLTLCPCIKKNGEPCSRRLNGYVHLIGCKSHGLHDDKRPREIESLVTSIPRTPGPYNAEYAKFDEGNQADGLIIYGSHLPRGMFPINNRAQAPMSIKTRTA
jgi:hypothetical protein